jgi:hypothetical protein
MLDDLEANVHEVVLIPAGDPQHSGHKIRVAQSHNCDWYRKFSGLYTNCRGIGRKRMKRARTFILKSNTARTLRRMIDGNFEGVQAERLIRFIDDVRGRRKVSRNRSEVSTLDPDFSF